MQIRTAETVAHAPAPLNVGDAPLAQFFIPAAASLQERRPRILKHGDTFAVFDHNGDALVGPGSPEGLYHRDTRHLSHFYLTIGGVRPMLLSSNSRDDNASLTCDLTNPDLYDAAGRLVLAHDLIHIRRSRFLWNGACFERLSVRNFDESRRCVRIEIAFAADFADIFEVRGTRRERRGSDHPAEITPHSVTLAYTGLDARRRDTELHFDPAPVVLTESQAVFEFSLAPREAQLAFLEIHCDGERHRQKSANGEASLHKRDTRRAFFMALRDSRRALRISSSRAAAVATSNEICNEAVRRSVSDLYMLVTDTPEGPYPYAGIPWFSTVFGRDALITALEMLWLDPNIARGVLCHLAANQATQYDPVADAEPGKILHELRQGEMAELGEVPFRRYYGSVDSTPLFVMLAGAYLERTGDLAIMAKLWPHIDAALKWIETDGDRDGDGFVEYGRRTADGLINQGWKDSHDSIFHADGRLASGPIALVEVQAYVYGAWQAAEQIAQALGYGRRVQEFNQKACILRKRFDESFFDADLATYVLALDGHKQPCRVRASNAGHALFTGIALPDRASVIVETLMARSSFSGWGVRTIATTEARYNPMSYHNGSVWPHDNAIIAAGFARYGFRLQAAKIFEGLFSSSLYIDQRRLPELFCGFPRQRSRGPTFYPVACIPQAWAAAAPLSLIQSCLGLRFNMAERETIFDEPVLPDFLDEITLHRLAVGGGSVDVALRRAGHQVVVNVLSRRGNVRVLTRS